MRIREYNKAKKRFIKTLQLQSEYTIAKTNLLLLQKLMSNEDYNKGIQLVYTHTVHVIYL